MTSILVEHRVYVTVAIELQKIELEKEQTVLFLNFITDRTRRNAKRCRLFVTSILVGNS